jgi:hypothetical protein
VTVPSNVQRPTEGYKEHKKSRRHDTTEVHKFLINYPRVMEIYKLPIKAFKIVVLKKLNVC